MNRYRVVISMLIIVLSLSIMTNSPVRVRAEYIDGETVVETADPDYGLTRMITIPSGLCGVLVGWVGIYEDMYATSVSNNIQGLTWNGDNFWTPAPELFSGIYCKTVLTGIARDGSGGAFGVGIGTTSVAGVNCLSLVHINAAGDEVQFDISGASASGAVFDPGVVFDGSGGAIVSWRECPEGEDYHVIKAQRSDNAGNALWAGGTELCYGEGYCYTPVIVEDDAGGCIVAWIDYRSGRSLYAQRASFAGLPMWTANGVEICGAGGYEENCVMIADGSGGAILAWNDDRNGDNDIFAQRIDADGTLLWVSGGLAVCQASGEQDYPALVGDGSGGAFIVWRDSRSGDMDIYVQRVDSGGNVLLDMDGAGIVQGPADQRCPRIVKDGSGGAVVAWVDESGGDCDIYALMIDGAGAVCSGAGFLPVCTAEGDHDAIAIATDCVGGAIVSWIDYRDSGTGEIRAFHLQATVTDAAETVPDARISLGQNWPNPFNPVTVIPFDTSEPGRVVLKVFDTAGRQLRTLIDEVRPAGRYSTIWDGRDETGSPVSSGFYYYRITLGAEYLSKKMILLR